jgi:hypothetical protein
MKRIVLISCASRKGIIKAKARELYKGPLFTNSLAYGISLNPDKIFILSALHHLLDLDTEIEPYNVTLCNIPKNKRKSDLKILTAIEKNDWGKKVIEKLKIEADIKKDEFIILAGQEYIKPIEGYITNNNLKKPLEGKRVGERIKFMQNKINYVKETETIIS